MSEFYNLHTITAAAAAATTTTDISAAAVGAVDVTTTTTKIAPALRLVLRTLCLHHQSPGWMKTKDLRPSSAAAVLNLPNRNKD